MAVSAVIAVLSTISAVAASEVVNFDLAWRHKLGDPKGKWFNPEYNDTAWEVVDAPHDMLITGKHSPDNPATQGFLARGVGAYRKHFTLPDDWQGQAVWVWFEGAFHEVEAWLNGHPLGKHVAGYTSFSFRVDQLARPGETNVLAMRVNASTGTGWCVRAGLHPPTFGSSHPCCPPCLLTRLIA